MAETDKLFTKGKEAFEKKNYDYAIDLFKQVLSIDPDHVSARQALRGTALKKCQDAGFPSAVASILKSIGPRIASALGGKNHQKKIDAWQDFLCTDPNNAGARINLGKALSAGGHVEGAIVEFEAVIALDQTNLLAARSLGDLYREKGDIKKAIEYYSVVTRKVPEDRHAAGALKDLLAEGSMSSGQYEGSSRDNVKDKDKAKELAESHKVYKTDEELKGEIAGLRAKIDADPTNPAMSKPWVKIGDLHMRQQEWDEATEAYEEGAKLDPNDPRIKMKIGDVRVKRYEVEIQVLAAEVKKNPDDEDSKSKLAELKAEKTKFQIAEWRKRVKEHPTDLGLRYELGTYLMDGGDIEAAIEQFQQTVKDPKRKLDSLDNLGQAFYKKKMYELAAGQFSKAIEATTLPDREKMLRYRLGVTYQQAKDVTKALDQYKKILEIDYSFKDVSKRVEELEKKGE